VRWISLSVLVAAGVLLAVFWGDVPDRWVIHWGLHGRPDAWATKSIAAAAAPLVIGSCVWLVMEVAAVWIVRGGARRTAALPAEVLAIQAAIARATGLAIALLTAGLTLALPLLHLRSSLPILVAVLADIAVVIGCILIWADRQMRRLRATGVALPDGYNGIAYRNPRDPRLWVPRLSGAGWTINFAHRLAWPAVIAIAGLLAAALIAARLIR